jgi:predicted GNAT superfamily acetyltransferase
MTQQADSILIRSCQGRDEFEACVQLEIETWGYDPADLIPNRSFMLSQKIGGQVIGAFDTSLAGTPGQGSAASLIGYVLAIPGIKPQGDGADRHYLHSHMLAVKSGYHNRGLGAKLKLFQRQEALSRGIRRMEWTFDPLEIKNAFLNIHKLGAIIRRYYPDFYGVSSSRLQGGLPTDRLVAEWYLDSPRVAAIAESHTDAECNIVDRITVPASIYQWKASDENRDRALAVQLENRGKFQKAFERGLAVVGFTRDADGNGIYELVPYSTVAKDIESAPLSPAS